MKRLKTISIIVIRVLIITMMMSLFVLEGFIRFNTNVSADGLTSYRGMPIRPLSIPVSNFQANLQSYLDNLDDARLLYDAELGWRFAANRHNNPATNSDGLVALRNYEQTPETDILRIAVFGDSYIAGDEVEDDETFPIFLEAALLERGTQAEVLNFGVSGYGMDQAYLYWRNYGQDYQPDIVIMGFQPENMNRNVNIIRSLAAGSGIPFSKPRFVLNENRQLELINSPTIPPNELMNTLENFEASPLAQYEWHYNERFQANLLSNSNLWGVIEARNYNLNYAQNIFIPSLSADDERVTITLPLMQQFATETQATGQTFILLHIPMRVMMQDYLSGTGFSYQFVIDELEQSIPFIHSENTFMVDDAADWMSKGHYSARRHQIIAEYTADWLLNCIAAGNC